MGTYAKNIARLASYWWQFWPSLIAEIFFHSHSLNLEGPQLSNQENIQVFSFRLESESQVAFSQDMQWLWAVGFERLISGSVGMCIFLFLDHRAAPAQNKAFTNMKQLHRCLAESLKYVFKCSKKMMTLIISSFFPKKVNCFWLCLFLSSRAQQCVHCVLGSAASFPSIPPEGHAAPPGPHFRPRPGCRPSRRVPLRFCWVSGGDPGGVGQTGLFGLCCYSRRVFTQACPGIPSALTTAQD